MISLYIILAKPFSEKREYTDLEEHLGIQIPDTASNIEADYKIGRLHYISLSFDAPSEDMEKFVNHFCDGRLYQGYDPFNAENIDSRLPDKNLDVHLIIGADFTYYSYSTNVSAKMYGNRCRERGHFRYLLVDESDATLYRLIFKEDLDSCHFPGNSVEVPCMGGGSNHINPHANMPFMIAGMASENGNNIVIAEGFCIEARTHVMVYDPSFYPSFSDSRVDIYIDGQLRDSTRISGKWRRLEPSAEKADGSLFNYCYWDDWDTGIHAVTIDVTKSDNTQITSQIEFSAR